LHALALALYDTRRNIFGSTLCEPVRFLVGFWFVEKAATICYSGPIFVKEVVSMEEKELLSESKGRRFGGSLAAGIALGIGGGGAVGAALGNVFIGGLIGLILGVLLGLAIGNVKPPEA